MVIGQGYYERQWVLPLFQSVYIYNFFNLPLTKISSKYDDYCLRCDNEPVERMGNYSMLGEWRKIRVLTTYAKLDFAEPADQRIHTYIIWFTTPHRGLIFRANETQWTKRQNVTPTTVRNKFNEWSERSLNPGSPYLKASAHWATLSIGELDKRPSYPRSSRSSIGRTSDRCYGSRRFESCLELWFFKSPICRCDRQALVSQIHATEAVFCLIFVENCFRLILVVTFNWKCANSLKWLLTWC